MATLIMLAVALIMLAVGSMLGFFVLLGTFLLWRAPSKE